MFREFYATTLWGVNRLAKASNNGSDLHAFVSGGDTLGKLDVPATFVVVHLHDHGCGSGNMVDRAVQQHKVRPQLRHGQSQSVDEQAQVHPGGMATLTGDRQNHG